MDVSYRWNRISVHFYKSIERFGWRDRETEKSKQLNGIFVTKTKIYRNKIDIVRFIYATKDQKEIVTWQWKMNKMLFFVLVKSMSIPLVWMWDLFCLPLSSIRRSSRWTLRRAMSFLRINFFLSNGFCMNFQIYGYIYGSIFFQLLWIVSSIMKMKERKKRICQIKWILSFAGF